MSGTRFAAGGKVGLVEPPVDGGAGAVVLADRVDAGWVGQQRAIVFQRFRRERREVARLGPALERVLEIEHRVFAISVSGMGLGCARNAQW